MFKSVVDPSIQNQVTKFTCDGTFGLGSVGGLIDTLTTKIDKDKIIHQIKVFDNLLRKKNRILNAPIAKCWGSKWDEKILVITVENLTWREIPDS